MQTLGSISRDQIETVLGRISSKTFFLFRACLIFFTHQKFQDSNSCPEVYLQSLRSGVSKQSLVIIRTLCVCVCVGVHTSPVLTLPNINHKLASRKSCAEIKKQLTVCYIKARWGAWGGSCDPGPYLPNTEQPFKTSSEQGDL